MMEFHATNKKITKMSKKLLTFILRNDIILLVHGTEVLIAMRKCRNWQTSKTKDLVIIAIVWVQVPSSALKKDELG